MEANVGASGRGPFSGLLGWYMPPCEGACVWWGWVKVMVFTCSYLHTPPLPRTHTYTHTLHLPPRCFFRTLEHYDLYVCVCVCVCMHERECVCRCQGVCVDAKVHD